MNVEQEMYDYTGTYWSNRNSNRRLKKKFGNHARSRFNRFTSKDSHTGNITRNMVSTAVWNWRPERWGSPLVREKCQEEKTHDKRRRRQQHDDYDDDDDQNNNNGCVLPFHLRHGFFSTDSLRFPLGGPDDWPDYPGEDWVIVGADLNRPSRRCEPKRDYCKWEPTKGIKWKAKVNFDCALITKPRHADVWKLMHSSAH